MLPSLGSTAGNDSVTVLGTGLNNGIVYFGPTVAQDWACVDDECVADSPPSVSAGPWTTVVTPSSTSAVVAADTFVYEVLRRHPPPPR